MLITDRWAVLGRAAQHSAKKIERASDCKAFAQQESWIAATPSVSQAGWQLMTMNRLRSSA